MHRFPYKWTLKDAVFTKDKGTVFSCFACGGGSSMGYKLAGFDVIGCNEIDPKMMAAYKANLNPKYAYLEPIQTFKLRDDLPDELYHLDILDGSPPCSNFSMAGNREKDWGKEKKFREGQVNQVLDTLFFDFIDLAKKLQPKVVIAENVKGLLLGEAISYVREIYKQLDEAGYYCQHWLLDASKMGVPQRRERVFFIALRKDLAEPFLYQADMFTILPKLKLEFNEKQIIFTDIWTGKFGYSATELSYKYWSDTIPGNNFSEAANGSWFNHCRLAENKVIPTLTTETAKKYHLPNNPELIDDETIILASSFPEDYQFVKNTVSYITGMSVPPVMMAQIASEVYNQWLKYI
ncbi:MAG TPA: DNA (cytosine-5-)-methyltransferase [Candidatus Cloacimonadota bacterium]|nr:DNA (cytosine-5-)-methyltransferase [Candidatus Cloacimonadota bacterium]